MPRQLDAVIMHHRLQRVLVDETLALGEALLLREASEDVLPLVLQLLSDLSFLRLSRILSQIHLRECLLAEGARVTGEAWALLIVV